ncbi:MAG TPA: hypothetical protein VFP84_17750 [Kofleriaceae bacterium]|nr:hypothetical protein [Kofleriaceae bacterium]
MLGSQHQKQGSTGSAKAPVDSDPAVGKSTLTGSAPQGAASGPPVSASAIAQEIVSSSDAVHDLTKVRGAVDEWKGRVKPLHDVEATLKLIKACKALSTNHHVVELLAKNDEASIDQVKQIVRALEGLVHRQIVQQWDNPRTDVAARGEAWDIFVGGVEATRADQKQLDLYLGKVLAHDKGYGQTHDATQSFLFLEDHGADQPRPFAEVLNIALGEPFNQNIWTGGQAGSGKIVTQLQTGLDPALPSPSKPQEKMMWSLLLTAIFKANSPMKDDWGYIKTVRASKAELLATVSGHVKKELHADLLDEALDLMDFT